MVTLAPQTTFDAWVWANSENAQKIIECLTEFGFGKLNLSVDDFTTHDQVVQLGYPPYRIDIITSISGVEFDWNEKADSVNTGHDFGVIAQEILDILPEAVKQRDTGYLAVRYDRIIPLLVEAVKELNKEIKELKSKK